MILASVERLHELEDNEPRCHGTRRVCDLWKFVRHDHEPRRQPTRPRISVLPVDREAVLPGDGQQSFNNDGAVSFVRETSVRNQSERFSDEWTEAKVGRK